ncbi:hypothetical protein [Dactylosporangium sp. NPDC050588]|uniref:hypothetical protein n=1 Tax=Dactylosporangium sp. NPDC050588 TaxID=3157211 RepID=UPI0033C2F207
MRYRSCRLIVRRPSYGVPTAASTRDAGSSSAPHNRSTGSGGPSGRRTRFGALLSSAVNAPAGTRSTSSRTPSAAIDSARSGTRNSRDQ